MCTKFFRRGGLEPDWVGDPDKGFGPEQPGGWIYNVLPFIEDRATFENSACDFQTLRSV